MPLDELGVALKSGGSQIGGHKVPVHQLLEEGGDVVRTAILVVEIVSVLPHVHGEQGLLTVGQGQIGVAGFGHLEGAIVEHQPGPAAAELGGTCSLELLNKSFEAAEIGSDLVSQGARGLAATTGLDALPVEAVVPDLGGIVEDACLARITGHGGDGLFEALAFQVTAGHQVVQVGDVGVVVLAVVKLQGLARDVGLERIKAVGQRGQRVSHGIRSQ